MILLVAACAPDRDGDLVYKPNPNRGDDSAITDTGDGTWDSGAGTDDTEGPCPVDMAPVGGSFCIDRFEAALQEYTGTGWADASPYETVDGREVRAVPADGAVPQGYISGDEAAAACEAADKRLCESSEWLSACQGPQEYTWPYGDSYQSGACNDSYSGGHPVTDYFGTSSGVWDTEHMNDSGINQQPDTVSASGNHTDCVSDWGVYDLHGNLHEWIADSDGTFRGGFYADASINGAGCGYVTTAHSTGYHDYSTGFRCCSDL